MKKITKTLLTMITAFLIIATSMLQANAASDSIQLGTATKKNGYIAGVSFSDKVTTDGRYLYCLNMHKNTATNVKATLVKNSSYIDGGIVYILKNGYPNKSITGDKDKDYYITQTAVWWYLDNVKGMSNLGDGFKNTGSDPYDMRKYVRNLVNEAYNHRNDAVTSTVSTKLVLNVTTGDNELVLKDGYYLSHPVKAVTADNIGEYTVTLKDAPKGTIIVKNNEEKPYTGAFTMNAKNAFRVKVPTSSITNTKATIKIEANANGYDHYTAHEYQPTDNNMQNIALLEKITSKATASMNLTIDSSIVSITKVDSTTKKAISGAKLVLKDSTGKVVASWTSTINAHVIRNLANGTYTVEETEAPSGYLKNTNKTTITITDTNRNIKVTFENAPKNVVVNITKVDSETNAALAGAVLLVKDSTGKEVARFTTTTSSYVLKDLANGTYTVEEVSAPSGYIKSNDKITFTVDDNHLSHQIIFKNTKEVPVPDTDSTTSIILLVIGVLVTGLGITYIKKNAKA